MSRPVAGKNKKGEGRPRAAVKKTNEKTILPYDDIPMPGAVAGAGGDFLSGEPQYRRTGQRRPAERRYGRALERRAARGFSKESAEHIADGRGYSFAKLTYEKDVADILAKWETPAADMQARFDAVIDVQLADASTTQADAALIEAARPTLDESWVCFSLQSEDDPNDVILLAYQSATHVMIVAEQQK